MAEWTAAYINDLPDSAFACIDPGGKKDEQGKTVPRSLRHYPHHDASGKLDMPHLRNAMSRVSQAGTAACGKTHLMTHGSAEGMGKADDMDYLKAEQISGSKWRVLAIPFGGPFKGKDLDGEFFSPRTDIKPDWFDRRPLVWHHAIDGTMKADPVLGTADDTEKDDDGWWSTIWLDRSHRYWAAVDELLRAGKIFGSSGSLPNFVRTDRKTGEILVWPYIEQTLTPTPSNPYSTVVAAKAIAHFDEANLGLHPALRGMLTDLDSPEADLPSDLDEESGDEEAIQRLTGAITHLEELLKELRR